MNRSAPAFRALILTARQLRGLRAALLEAITAEILAPDELRLARSLREGLGLLDEASRSVGDLDSLGILCPMEYSRVAMVAVEHVLTTLLPFETSMRVLLDKNELESLKRTLWSANGPD
jgi:hypothetical protein